MSPDEFLQISDRLLQRHYAISAVDTGLCEPDVIEGFLGDSVQPFEAVNEWANKVDLTRVDRHGRFGHSLQEPLNQSDQDRIVETFSNPSPLHFRPSPGLPRPSAPGF